ncbi:P-loop containing nucleoside triphosphate hydrolase protein [Phellopilus nigrolimitatus]|nr:P-loop containing nucleoside triphosphate hydrolase protein [Phellopilus nigrolimitatus]
MDLLKSVFSPLGMNAGSIQDTFKWVVIGGTVETARRVSKTAWNGFVDSFFLTAHFSQEDYPYDWLMHWLSKQPAWGQSREFEITTRSVGRASLTQTTTGDLEEDDDCEEDEEDALVHGRRKRKVAFMPSIGTTHTIYYRGHWLRITRSKRTHGYHNCAELSVSVVARNNNILKKLVLEAKKEYEKDAEHRVHIFMADSYGSWRWNGARQKRPMSSIVLEPGVKDMLLADCRDFLRSEDWYAERGIPFRRGYLLHGVPGSGKTSLIHSMAGELGLDIYVVSLSSKGMSDNTLATLMGQVPSRCILLLEDLDAAFTRSVSRDEKATGTPTSTSSTTESTKSSSSSSATDGSTLSLSGLLNGLDGVAAAEGRLLFATTNHIERLDPALSRPGRMDVWVNFTNATKWQAEGIFKCFFPSRAAKEEAAASAAANAAAAAADDKAKPGTNISQKNMPGMKRKTSTHAVPVLEEDEINALARRFAEQIPEDEMSVASLQGYLLKNKTRPRESVDEVAEWIIKEREQKAKLKKEKEEKEMKEKLDAEEKAAKEKAEEKAEKAKQRQQKAEKKEEEKTAKKEKTKAERRATETPPSKSTAATQTATDASDSSPGTSDSECSGADADTEDSMTTDEEVDKLVDAATTTEAAAQGSGKWVNVKNGAGAETQEATPPTSPESVEPVPATTTEAATSTA